MIRIGVVLLGLFLSCASALAQTPQLVRECIGTAGNCVPVSSTNPIPITPSPSASGGLTPAPLAPALATSQVIKSGAGNLYSFDVGDVCVCVRDERDDGCGSLTSCTPLPVAPARCG